MDEFCITKPIQPKPMQFKKLYIEIPAALFVLLWVYAALSKLLDYQTFKTQLGKSPLITEFAGLAAVIVPVAELIIAGLLVLNRTRLVGFYASFFLMTVFTGYLIAILNFSYHIPCSCGGILGSLGWKEHIVFNFFFIVLSLLAIILSKGKMQDKQLYTMSEEQ